MTVLSLSECSYLSNYEMVFKKLTARGKILIDRKNKSGEVLGEMPDLSIKTRQAVLVDVHV